MDPAIPLRVALSALALLAFAGDVLIGPGPRGARWFSGHVLCAVALALVFAMSGGAGQSAEFALGWVVGWSVCLDLVIALAALSRAVVVPHAATVAVGAALLARSVLSFTGPGAAGRAAAVILGAALVGAGGWWAHRRERAPFPAVPAPVRNGLLFGAAATGVLFACSAATVPGAQQPAAFAASLLALLGAPRVFGLVDRAVARATRPQVALSVLLAFAGVKTGLSALVGATSGETFALAIGSFGVLAAVIALSAVTAVLSPDVSGARG